MAQKYRFWSIWNYFSIFPEPCVGRNIRFAAAMQNSLEVCVSNGRWRGSFAAFPGPWLKNNGVLFFNFTIIVYCSYLINSFVSNPRLAKCRKPTVFWPLGFTVFFAFSFLNMFFAMCPRSWLRNVDSVSYFQFRLTFKFSGPGKLSILPCSQTCLIVIPYVCTFCPIKLDAKKVHGYVHTSSSPPCAGPSGLWFDMWCSCMLCFMASPCI